MGVKLARVDERLVHGQIITTWSKQLKIDNIFIVDDSIVNDPFIYQVLTLSAPSGMHFEVLSIDQVQKKVEENFDKNILILFKSLDYAYKLIESGFHLKELNLGNLGAGPNRKSISKNISVSPQEIELIKLIINSGCNVYLQMLYSDQKVDVKNIL